MHESIFKSILGSDMDLRRCLLGNIVLSGTVLCCVPAVPPWFCSSSQYSLNNLFPVLMKEGTLCSPGCPTGSRLKSRASFQPARGHALASPAPHTETAQCGAEERCWPACLHSAVPGSVGRNMRSMGRRSSSGSVSEIICTQPGLLCDMAQISSLSFFYF